MAVVRFVGKSLENRATHYARDFRRGPNHRVSLHQRAVEHGVHLLAYGTVAGGWLTERWLDQAEPDWERTGTWSQMKYGRFIRTSGGWEALQRVLRAAANVAARHGVSIANVATR